MQADVQKRRPVCFYRHFYQCFSRLRTLEFSGCRNHSWQRSDDPPTVWPDLGSKLSAISESLGKRGYTGVAIEEGVRNKNDKGRGDFPPTQFPEARKPPGNVLENCEGNVHLLNQMIDRFKIAGYHSSFGFRWADSSQPMIVKSVYPTKCWALGWRWDVDLSSFKDLGNLPFSTVGAAALWHLLGPTAKYLGGRTQELTQVSIENLERMFRHALKRLPNDVSPDEPVPPRLLRSSLAEGAFTEDEVASAYLGGVLASSKSEKGRDDRGVCMNALISRMSVFQLRLHFVTYTVLHELFQGTKPGFDHTSRLVNQMQFGTIGFLIAMGFIEDELHRKDFCIDSAISHAVYGLHKEELISDWSYDWDDGFKCSPTPIGVELFLWANGHGKKPLEYFFDREFLVPEDQDIQVTLLRGRNVKIPVEGGDPMDAGGYDFGRRIDTMLACELKPRASTFK